MKLVLTQREQLLSVGKFLVDEFDSLIARIRGAWTIEHTDDGRHGNVTAQSLSTGRLTFSDIATATLADAQADNFAPNGISTAALLRLSSDSLTPITITGLLLPQTSDGAVLDGRTLVVENASSVTTFVLASESTYSSPSNRFRTPAHRDATDEASPAQIYLAPVSITLLTYNATLARWIVHSRNVDDNVRAHTLAGATTHNNLTLGNWLSLRTLRVVFSSASGQISGFSSEAIPETTRKTVINAGLYAADILHQNTGSSSANRVSCPGGVRYRLHPREACELIRTADGWRIAEKADQWIDVTFAAGNFTASAGNWTLIAANQATFTYQIDGNMMTVSFELETTTVSTTPATLSILIPGGRVAARAMSAALAYVVDAGTPLDTGRASVAAAGTTINLTKNAAGTTWAAGTTTVRGQITFMVRDDTASISESHTDVPHADTGHSDAGHTDVAHADVPHADAHTDDTHSDASHSDVAFADIAHADTAHADTAHADTAHVDVAHGDIPAFAHNDVGHADIPHSDTAHSDVTHEDTAHSDTAHSDTAHSDTAHGDSAHSDVPHGDTTDYTPHSDTAHVDGGHGDTPHADTAHEDVGYHADGSHADV